MPILAKEISFRYASKAPLVLDGISCSIRSGAITAIVGPNGSGKSTLIRLLAGLRVPESGQIQIDTQELHTLSHPQRAQQIAFIEQRPTLAFDFETRRVLEFGAFSDRGARSRIDEAIHLFELNHCASKPFGHLSVGQQQRVSIARAWVQIAQNQRGYLLADEPCSAMDPRHAHQTMHTLRSLADSGVGVALVIHDLTTAARWGDHAIVLNQTGTVEAEGKAGEVLTMEVLSKVFEIRIRRHEIAGNHPVLIPELDSDGSEPPSG